MTTLYVTCVILSSCHFSKQKQLVSCSNFLQITKSEDKLPHCQEITSKNISIVFVSSFILE